MRQRIVLAVLTASLLALSVMTGCGTLAMDLHTTVKTSGDIIQEIRFEGTGMMATMLEEADFTADFEQDGWVLDVERMDDSVIVTATGSFTLDEDIIIPQVEGGPALTEGFSARVEDGLLSKNFFIEVDVLGSEDELGNEDEELDEMFSGMLEGMFDISWTITLPGNIVESKADIVEGSSATWNFDINSLTSGFYLMVHSQYKNWPVIGGIIAGVVVVLALVAFFFIRRRRTPAISPSEITD
jgi:hypothetical protein